MFRVENDQAKNDVEWKKNFAKENINRFKPAGKDVVHHRVYWSSL